MTTTTANERKRISHVLPVALVMWLASSSLGAQVNDPKYRDYFLIGQFGEVCTMCEVTVLCEAAAERPDPREALPDNGSYTIYHLQTRTFWSQVSTIWEWFISNFATDALSKRGHTRPVHVHRVVDGAWQPMQIVEARLVLEPGVIELGEKTIDRETREWLNGDSGEAAGYCQRLPLWETLEVIENRAAGGESS